VTQLQNQYLFAQGEIESLESQVRQRQQHMDQLLSSLAATVDISAPILDAVSAAMERPAAFPTAVQQLCSQVCLCVPTSPIPCTAPSYGSILYKGIK